MDLYSILGQPVPCNEIHSSLEDASAVPSPLPAPLSKEDALVQRTQAESKLSATLHSAVERVRYITGATGVALALCENDEDAMVCRASSGLAAPEVGARMYIQSGITAESMRTRQTLRCDQASTDPRVNQESCKALGIESVMVMPLVLGRSVVGMLELFGERPSAFAGRDAKTLHATAPQVQSGLREAVNAGMQLGRIPWAEEATDRVATNDEEAREIEDLTTFTLKVPVAFPVTSFKKAEDREVEDQAIPAFLTRLVDEARPAASRSWSQWFRPQW